MSFDLRSDTFTLPSDGMRKAMADAEVGDDVYGEDPTANKLQEMVAFLTGKEESLIVSSGCMGNLIPLMIKGGRGKEVLCAPESHIVRHEIGAVSSLSGTLPVFAESSFGILDPESVRKNIHPYAYDMSSTSIIEVENTTSGLVYPLETVKEIKKIAEENKLWVHMDGARIFNAQVETGIPVKEWAKYADDITFCLSKGLGSPAFSVLSSSHEFIKEAKQLRKLLGGGMRQIGIFAAAGIYALENNVERLKDDHGNRKKISNALEETGWADIVISSTNMIFFTSRYSMDRIIEEMKKRGILMLQDAGMGRIVTNINVTNEDADKIVDLIKTIKKEDLA